MRKFDYLVILKKPDGSSEYYGSKSRNSAVNLRSMNAVACWVYDSRGRWVSFATLDVMSGKIVHPRILNPNNTVSQYVKVLKKLNEER